MRIYLAKLLFNLLALNCGYIWGFVSGIIFNEEGETIVVESSRANEVILKCPYQLEDEDEEGLAIYWYYNDIPRPLYQWIPFRYPQVIGFLKNFVDLSYQGSTRDYYRYRDIRLVAPSTNLTGKYTCKVSSHRDEEIYTVNLILYSSPSTFEVNTVRQEDGTIIVKCDAYPLYPEPRITLFKALQGKRIPLTNGEVQSRWRGGTYMVSMQAEVKEAELDGMTQFECHLRLPKTSISWKSDMKYIPRTLPNIHHVYSPVNSSSLPAITGPFWLFLTSICVFLCQKI